MIINKKYKNWIDSANYYQLLFRWRFAPIEDKIFIGEKKDKK